VQPLATFLQESNAVIAHDVAARLSQITVPTQITFGRHDVLTSTRFADRMTGAIRGSELLIFEECAHAPIYEKVESSIRRLWHSCSATRSKSSTYLDPLNGPIGLQSPMAASSFGSYGKDFGCRILPNILDI
jgi:hypothetical protein